MNVCLRNMVSNNLEEMKGKRWKEMNPAFCIHTMNDCLKMILEATPEELAAVQQELRTFLCTEAHPLVHYGAITGGTSHSKPPIFGQPVR